MNRSAVRAFAAKSAKLSLPARYGLAKQTVEQLKFADFDAEEFAVSSALSTLASRGVWFHGGILGLSVGDNLLPARLTAQDPRKCGKACVERGNYVFITPLLATASLYANLANGSVYIVQPSGSVAVDPAEIRAIQLLRKTYAPMETLWKAGPKVVAKAMVPFVQGYTCEFALIVGKQGLALSAVNWGGGDTNA